MNVSTRMSKHFRQLEELREPLTKFVREYNLSKREQDVLNLLLHRVVSAEDMSEKLGISRNTVRIHLKNLNTKVGVSSKSELLGRFIEFTMIGEKPMAVTSSGRELLILISDDDESYVNLVKEASQSTIGPKMRFEYARDGHVLLEYLEKSKNHSDSFPRPDLIMLDLNMPNMDGFQALERLKTDSSFKDIPVIIFTSSKTTSDIANIYALGGNSYVTKPGEFQDLKKVMQGIGCYWGQIGALPT